MIEWKRETTKEDICCNEEKEIIIDFCDRIAISSSEISILFFAVKECMQKNKNIFFKLRKNILREVLEEMGFEKLGVKFI
ncbi:MAG: hypothetical protein A2096_00080 [Spirochaetes bacterium GWF1_41_5]|nr:MAG: hypothetical protein A2096_00080 [Spirochaetes bacterium GWF1_41_5]HBE02591.1 hypothetical protein [Spirochaetia bacterium]